MDIIKIYNKFCSFKANTNHFVWFILLFIILITSGVNALFPSLLKLVPISDFLDKELLIKYRVLIFFFVFAVSVFSTLTGIISVSRFLKIFSPSSFNKKIKKIKSYNKSIKVTDKYKSLVYAQRAVCPKILFNLNKKKISSSNQLFLYRNIEEFNHINNELDRNNLFRQYKELDFLAYNDFLENSYYVMTYKDLDIWIIAEDLDYYLSTLKLNNKLRKSFGIKRMFVLNDVKDIILNEELWFSFIKLLNSLLGALCNNISILNSYRVFFEENKINICNDANSVKEAITSNDKLKKLFTIFSIKIHQILKIDFTIKKELPNIFEENNVVSGNIVGFGMFDKKMSVKVYSHDGILKYIAKFIETEEAKIEMEKIIQEFDFNKNKFNKNLFPSCESNQTDFYNVCNKYINYMTILNSKILKKYFRNQWIKKNINK